MTLRWIVVGAGAAGCAVTAELVAAIDAHVTVVESGPGEDAPGVRSASFFDALAEPGRVFPGPHRRGRGLGGSTAVNGMVAGRGFAGGLPVEAVGDAEIGPIGRALRDAVPDAAPVRLVRHGGHRVTAADHFLAGLPAGRVEVRAGCDVASVVLDGRRAVGVALTDGQVVEGDAVVLCAGALATPTILARTGVTAGVGLGLRNHPAVPILVRRRTQVDPHSTPITVSWRHGDVDVLAIEHLGPEEPDWAMLLTVVMTTSTTGSVRPDPTDPAGSLIDWTLDPSDRARLGRAAFRTSGILEHAAFASAVDDIVVGDGPGGVFHWGSSCAIGRVLDDRGAVTGHHRLFVADASAFAGLPVEHLMLPTIAQARRLARRFVPTVC
ncbi:MAG: GMC family oxidoreductase N-terminal domain-containing protein [Desertimonas sp.]